MFNLSYLDRVKLSCSTTISEVVSCICNKMISNSQHSFLLKRAEPPVCIPCVKLLAVEHVLLLCSDLIDGSVCSDLIDGSGIVLRGG